MRIRLKRSILAMLILLCQLPVTSSFAIVTDNLRSTRYTTLNGLSSNTIRCMIEDSNGYLWFGSSSGITRFDGYHFVNYKPSENLPCLVDNHIDHLEEDTSRHLLWIFSSNLGVMAFNLQTSNFVSYEKVNDKYGRYNHHLISDHNIILYDEKEGVRRLTFSDDNLHVDDYSVANARLKGEVNGIVCEDKLNRVWIPTKQGMALLDNDGSLRILNPERAWWAVRCHDDYVYALSTDGNVYVYALRGSMALLYTIASPLSLNSAMNVWYNVIWNGRWLISTPLGLMMLNMEKRQWETVPADWDMRGAFIEEQADGIIWGFDNAVRLFLPDGRVKHLSLISDRLLQAVRPRYKIVRGTDNRYIIAAYGQGIFIYDDDADKVEEISTRTTPSLIHSDYVLAVMLTKSAKTLWAACDFTGLSKIYLPPFTADMIYPAGKSNKGWDNFVRSIFPSQDGTLMLSCRDGKIYGYNAAANESSFMRTVPLAAYSYLEDSNGHQWIGTRGGGVLFDGKEYSLKKGNCPANDIYAMEQDELGRVWMASLGNGLLMARVESDTVIFHQYLAASRNQQRQHALLIDSQGMLWVGTDDGLFITDTRKSQISDADFHNYSATRKNFCQNEIICLKMDSDGAVWSGALGGGAARCEISADGALRYLHLDERKGLRNINVTSIQPDLSGHIWIGTEEGIGVWDPSVGVVHFMQISADALSNVYSENCSGLTAQGDVLLGTNYGLMRISPQIASKHNKSTAHVTDVLLNDQSLSSQCRYDINEHSLLLSYGDNNLRFCFSNLDYPQTDHTVYAWYLEGYEDPWCHVGTINEAKYTQLDPGTYTFHVKVFDNNTDSTTESLLEVVIRYPWWNTWWAWLIYIAVGTIIVILFVSQIRRNIRLHNDLQVEKNVTEFRLNFFTQISHEFRTPLSIISHGLDQMEQSQTEQESRSWLKNVRRGNNRLLKLVDQLLTFRRLNAGSVRLQVSQGDIVKTLKDIYMDFWYMADKKGLNYVFSPFTKTYTLPFDAKAIETIIYNILSNAVKYTPEHGNVFINLRHDEEKGMLCINVEDSGPGLTNEQQKRIFTPYMHGYVSQGGMGIGLYVAHNMATIHKGTLTYSQASGGGSVFTLLIPDDDRLYSPSDYLLPSAIETDENEIEVRDSHSVTSEPLPNPINDFLVLVVEDDADMAEMLTRQISTYFHVKVTHNGDDGLQKAKELLPSCILCDVMMPGIDGYEVTRRLKADDTTRHIPVIMLTALNDDSHHVKGIEAGVDAYLTKPCNSQVLNALIIKLVNERLNQPDNTAQEQAPRSIEQLLENIKNEPERVETVITDIGDKKFRDRLNNIVERRYNDTNFNVDELITTLHMGRSQFYKKCREVLGQSPNDYIRSERLRHAAEFLQDGSFNVNEVAYKVGFENASYFIRCFKSKYGVSPAQYKKI